MTMEQKHIIAISLIQRLRKLVEVDAKDKTIGKETAEYLENELECLDTDIENLTEMLEI